jgi:cation diffusion facilitator CzcD-associated flavoprotein CzcO
MNTSERSDCLCVIGAGAAGLTAAKNLLQYGFDVDVIDSCDDLGGNWNFGKPNSSIYRSVHTITSKPFTQYTDFPMPSHYPTFIGHRHALEYLRNYAAHFGVDKHIEYSRTVENIDRTADPRTPWTITLDGGQMRRYAGVVIANGHLAKPRFPTYPGTFDGVVLHSGEYKTPDVLRDNKVLVVGAGNSGCDIAVEASQNASVTLHSTRRGYHYWPKYLFGAPSDAVYELALKTRAPLPVRRAAGHLLLRLNSAGQPGKYGLQAPDHRLYEEHFIINSTLLYHLGHGDIQPKPDIAELLGHQVRFTDGSIADIDVIVYATGFDLTHFPFIDRRHLNWRGNRPALYLQAFHPVYDDMFLIGYFQTSTGNWPLMDYQAQVMSRYLRLKRDAPDEVAWFDRLKAEASTSLVDGGIDYYQSERHLLEVEHFAYRNSLRKLVRRMKVTPAVASRPPRALAAAAAAIT